MSTFLSDKARERFLGGSLDWDGDTVKAVLVDKAAYTPAPAVDEFLSAIPAGERVAISPALTGKTITAGVADVEDVTFPAANGDSVEAIVLFKYTGDPPTSPLIAFIDDAVGLPFTPSGSDVTVRWSDGPNRIFNLCRSPTPRPSVPTTPRG